MIIDPGHGLVKLSQTVNWDRLDEVFGTTYCPDNGRPAVSTRLMVALHYLKYTFNLSDDDVVAGWVENPYWQYLSGMKFFEHVVPIHPSSMTRWRNRIGEAGAEELLKETIATGLTLKAVKPHQLKRVNVDTTVQEKEVRFPTDARLYDRARQRLVDAAKRHDIDLRQNYNRKAKQLLAQQSRYAHAQQMKRAGQCTRKLKTYLGRVIRDLAASVRIRMNRYNHCWKSGPAFFIKSEKTGTRSTVCMNQPWNASAKAKPINGMSSAARSVWRPPAGAVGSWGPRRSTAIPMMAIRCRRPLSRWNELSNPPSRCSWIWGTVVTITPDPSRFMSTNDVVVEPLKACGVG